MIPFALVNAVLAAVAGFMAAGLPGAAIGVALWLAVLVAWRAAASPALRHATVGAVALGLGAGLRLLGLLMAVPIALLGLAVGSVLLLRDRALGVLPVAPPSLGLKSRVRHAGGFLAGFVAAETLPYTLANVLAMVVIGCVAIGMQVALYAALAAVPVVLVVLMMLAVDSSAEPGDDHA
ncbi:hypothetical protein [Zavarzinia sp.]|uniref:hypothetical protein n=1 Tax=Zavarzinia sp. TaxID=2027920 RepID=UPI003563CB0D